ncbi:Guanine nucleotide exchange factor lte1, partial [Rhizopus stolonifer]
KLIEKLTREIDNEFLMDFFLVFRQFLTPIKLCKLLILRFRWALLEDTDQRRLIRIRTFVVIRHWLTHYWTFDFLGSRTLRFMLSTFLTQLQTHPLILASPRDERIIKNLRTVFKRQRKHYSETHRKDSAISISTVPVPKWTSKMRHSIRKTWEDDSKHTRLLAYLTPSQPSSTVTTGYKSIILQYRSEIMAQQFCLIEQVMLQNVTWDELVELRWRKRSSKRQSFVIDMATLSQESDGICQWVASEIVRSQQSDIRIKVIEKFIRIALKCYQHRNYSTMMQILLGLQSPAVSRLEKTWQKVNHCEIELFNQLKEMAKPFRNWKNVRDCMTEAVEEIAESFAVESVLTKSQTTLDHKQGCIPFLGLYLSDLVFVAELPTFIQSSCSDNHDNIRDNQLCERLNHHLVNYNKFRITASVVKHVLAFQVLSRTYKFKIQHDLYTQLQSLSLLDNAQ